MVAVAFGRWFAADAKRKETGNLTEMQIINYPAGKKSIQMSAERKKQESKKSHAAAQFSKRTLRAIKDWESQAHSSPRKHGTFVHCHCWY